MKTLLFDFARVLLFPKDTSYKGNLNELHRKLAEQPGYNPLDHFEFNTELLDYLKGIKDNVGLYIFTSETIQDDPALVPTYRSIFKEVFSAAKLGFTKKQPEAYRAVAELIGVAPADIIFVDDKKELVEASIAAGMQGIVYESNEQLLNKLKELLV